jgi:transcriptional regulator with XRE-family HTH domain
MAGKKKTTRRKPGRPKIQITAQMIRKAETLASKGLTKEQIAKCLGMGLSTLMEKQSNYPEFLEAIKKGQAKGLATITNALFQAARNGHVVAQIFYLKNRDAENWSDRRIQENIDRQADELGKITEEEAIRVAKNVILAAEQNEEARKKLNKKPTIQ